jgi:osomolarity two-component system, response regulator SKN7
MQAWEFKHPEFRADRKDNLDNIRRKAPAPRKANTNDDLLGSNHQFVLLSDTLTATQQQVQALQENFANQIRTNTILVNEILKLTKAIEAQHKVSREVVNHLGNIEQDRRDNSRNSNSSNHSTPAYTNSSGSINFIQEGMHDSPMELRRARDILNGSGIEPGPDPDLKRLSVAFAPHPGSSPESAGGASMMAPPGGPNVNPFFQDPLNDMRHLVYPVGQTIGIDPFATEHMNNIPYNRPIHENMGGDMAQSMQSQTPPGAAGAASQSSGHWGMKKPIILLVEDDKTCSRIGSKFLAQYECGVEVAVSKPLVLLWWVCSDPTNARYSVTASKL